MRPFFPGPPSSSAAPSAGRAASALARGVDLAVLAPSVHDTRPWLPEVHADRVLIRADRSRRPPAPDDAGRGLLQSVGAALLTVRVGLAAEGWAADVDRLPDPGDPDLLAVVRPVAAAPDLALAALAPALLEPHGRGARCPGGAAPDDLLRTIAAAAADEGAQLVPVRTESHRRLVARLAAPTGPAGQTAPGTDRTIVLVATAADTPLAWLRSGEAVQRVLLELALRHWAAVPVARVIDVPLARTQLRSALTWHAHPQLLLSLGPAAVPDCPHRDGARSGLG